MRASKLKNWTPGQTRYFTYYIIWPGENDYWVDQTPFNGPLDTMLPLTKFNTSITKMSDLRTKGETSWKDNNGIKHRVVIDEVEIPRKWGKSAR